MSKELNNMRMWSGNYLENKMGTRNFVSNENLKRTFEKAVDSTYPKSSSKRMKRYRSAFTTEQVNYLEKEFKKYPYIGNSRRKDVADILNIPERAVKIWFQNRRMKEKKESTKEVDEVKNLEVVSDPFRNFVVSNQKCISASGTLNRATNNDINEVNEAKIDLSVPRCVRSHFFKDISPAREVIPVSQESSLNNGPSEPKTLAQFSIDFSKKYKSEVSKREQVHENIDSRSENRHSPTGNSAKQEENTFHQSPVSTVPEDLSSQRNNYEYPSAPPQGHPMNLEATASSSSIPHLKGFYTHPYIPPGNIMWKPINVGNMMSTGFQAINVPTSTPVISQHNMPKSCNCDCHLKPYCSPIVYPQANPGPQVQYVITAVPFHNPTAKF